MLSDPQEGLAGLQEDVQKALKMFQRATLHDLSPSHSLPYTIIALMCHGIEDWLSTESVIRIR